MWNIFFLFWTHTLALPLTGCAAWKPLWACSSVTKVENASTLRIWIRMKWVPWHMSTEQILTHLKQIILSTWKETERTASSSYLIQLLQKNSTHINYKKNCPKCIFYSGKFYIRIDIRIIWHQMGKSGFFKNRNQWMIIYGEETHV